ncbi:MAG: hypothetical protein KJ893_02230 [Candidatus Omnitrophica bacterium]|nr:hypothetical protein [Candidatus Omnitrophota bacterium]MBU4479161.1 hypothetical protein [Candidatus Omnitrophota bacterium]MCG2703792.1 hypothetical protein [Candidatus Omnitrophota bacterium]
MTDISKNLKSNIERAFGFRLNNNQYKELRRLFYEIMQRENMDEESIMKEILDIPGIEKIGGRNKFFPIKAYLLGKRFPLASARAKIDAKSVFLADLKPALPESDNKWKKPFVPQKVFIEHNARDSYLAKRFYSAFPQAEYEELDFYGEYLHKHKFTLTDLKKPLVFIVKEKWDFIRPCPCTKNHLGCNYWIFNLGFGCPYDCSYCFLQQYTNFPGIVLPANLDDFFSRFDDFHKKISAPIRIGTGEFCDSLVLDDITGYSRQLIGFFKNKPVFFELKTKSAQIENILKVPASANIVISWSLNPQCVIDKEERGVASLKERILAAEKVQKHGFSIAFHFDPIIYSQNWERMYGEVIDSLYTHIKPPLRWISLGTLRGTRELKNISEQRFPQSKIFYGELFLGEDKKLRYPKFLRKQIYSFMLKYIRKYDPHTPVYLCMEDNECWQAVSPLLSSSEKIEKYLLSQ